MIFTGFSPNTSKKDIKIALSYLFLPWKWREWHYGQHAKLVEQYLVKYLPIKYVFTFDSGRSSLYLALMALGVGEGDEVIVQSYTCIVVINAVKTLGAIPVYVDVENNFNARISDIQNKITDKTRAIIVQYTFGKPNDIEKIMEIARRHNIKVIEDCAHALGAEYTGKKLGTFGDLAMFSFGSDKIISSVRGGAVATNNDELADKLRHYQQELPPLPRKIIWQHLNNLIFFPAGKKLYSIGLGKIILYLVNKLKIINKIIYQEEKEGRMSAWSPAQYPNVLANLAYEQLKLVDGRNQQRKKMAELYDKKISNPLIIKPKFNTDSIYLRYTILTPKPKRLRDYAEKHGIILGDWYSTPIAPKDINIEQTGYRPGMCPNDERLAQMSVNLPTNVSKKQADDVIKIINQYD